MKYLSALLLFLCFNTVLSSAQNAYQKGYVVTSAGDTIHGMISSFQHERNPSTVDILRSDNSKTQQFDLNTAKAFGVYGKFEYKCYRVTIGKVLETEVFLKVVITGSEVSLLSYTNESRTFFYTMENSAQPTELLYREYTDPNTGGPSVDAQYKIQLQKLAATYHPGNQKLIDDIQTADYKDYTLVKIIAEMNRRQVVQNTGVSNSGYRFNVGVNANFNTTTYTGAADYDELNGASPYHAVSPQVNFGVDYLFNKDIQSVVLRAELGLSTGSASFSNHYDGDYAQPTNIYLETMKYNQFNVSLTPQIIWNIYNGRDFKFYIDGGVALQYLSYSNKVYTNTQTYKSTNTTTVENQLNDFPPLKQMVYDVPLKAGVVINNRIEIYGGYVAKTSYTNDSNASIDVTTYQVGLNYLFGIK